MGQALQKLLTPPAARRRTLSVSMSAEHLELIDKLAYFIGEQSGQTISRNQVIEEALEEFLEESRKQIRSQYEVDIHDIAAATLERGKYIKATSTVELDTIVVPAKDNLAYRKAFFEFLQWSNVRSNEDKLSSIKYIAIYVGAPTSGITHYAPIAKYENDPEHDGRYILHLHHEPIALPQPVLAEDSNIASGMRSSRYTSLALLKQAETIRGLFESI